MKQPKIIIAGIGPGNKQDITPAVVAALQEADAVVSVSCLPRLRTSFCRLCCRTPVVFSVLYIGVKAAAVGGQMKEAVMVDSPYLG